MASAQDMKSWMEEFRDKPLDKLAEEVAINNPNKTKALAAQIEIDKQVAQAQLQAAQAQQQAAQAVAEAAKAQKAAELPLKWTAGATVILAVATAILAVVTYVHG
jgi:hypothetical protein